ncbi:MAG TPA: DoxX family protein [Hyphomicrobiales bacterium]|nr:DoxX family protein [Hyphomicrobiales bacterium]
MTSVNYLAAAGRLMIAAIFLASGVQKLLTPEQTQQYIASVSIPMPVVAYWVAVAVEIIGGACLVVGFGTRSAALALAAFALATAIGVHNNFADTQQFIHFMKNIAIAGGLLQVVSFGSGGLSISSRKSWI